VASVLPLVALSELADLIGVTEALLLAGGLVFGAGLASSRLSGLSTVSERPPPVRAGEEVEV
jgi:hypothetical protein